MTQVYKVQVSMNQAHLVDSGFVWKQGDFGFQIEIEVLDFDCTGVTPQIIFRKSAGAVESTTITQSTNKFTYTFAGTELDTPGPGICDLKLKNSTTQRISTASFKFFVLPDTEDGLNEEASSYSDTVGQLVDDLQNMVKNTSYVGDFVDLANVTMIEGSYLKSDGTIGTNANFMLSDYIEIPDGVYSATVNRVVIKPDGTRFPQTQMVWWYDSEKTLFTSGISNTTSGDLLTSDIIKSLLPKYIRVNFARYHSKPFVKLNYTPALRYTKFISSTESLNDYTSNGIYWVGNTNTANLPIAKVGILTVNAMPFNNGHIEQIYATSTNTFCRFRTSGTWKDWYEYTNFSQDDVLGIVGKYTGSFTSARQQINTNISLGANKSYVIKFNKPIAEDINIWGAGNNSNFKRVPTWYTEVTFTNDSTARNLVVYNVDGGLIDVDLTVFEIGSVKKASEEVPRLYKVNKTATRGDYTSLSRCLFDLKDDHSPKIIEIWEGDYDIYDEYKELYDAGLLDIYTGDQPNMDYFDYCVWVPENTHIIGKGIVRLKWEPDPTEDDITPNQCKTISPLNVAASCTVENVEVYCKNGRYCLHNDGLGKTEFTGAIQKYINCRFYKYDNDTDSVSGLTYGFLPTTGFGIDRAMHHVYENCTFVNYASERAFYGHRRDVVTTENESSDITLSNCVITSENAPVCVKFGNAQSDRITHIRVMFNSCFISGLVKCQLESSGSSPCANSFDIQYLNCGNVSMQINDSDNPYPPKAYNTELTIVS